MACGEHVGDRFGVGRAGDACPGNARPRDARRLIVFSDMDGTFVHTDKSVPAANLAALDALGAHGGVFVPCTGRPAHMLPAELLDHPATRYAVSTNGACVSEAVDAAGGTVGDGMPTREWRRVRSVGLGRERALALLDRFSGLDVVLDAFTDAGALMARADYDRLDEFVPEANTLRMLHGIRRPVDGSLGDAVSRVEGVERVTVFWRDPADAEVVRRACAADDSLSCVSSMPWNFEITDSRATKGSALGYVCERAGFDVADAVAFGDSSNDVPMLLAAGDGVSMANGTPEALAAADHVTELDNDHDGVADYLLRLLGERG